MGGGGWVAGLTENKTKPSSWGLAELGNKQTNKHKEQNFQATEFPTSDILCSTMASHQVNAVLGNIHDIVQSSGLHFMINLTPWSSYITIRRKFTDQGNLTASLLPPSSGDQAFTKQCLHNCDQLLAENNLLRFKNQALENAQADSEEETKVVEANSKQVVSNLHSKIDMLESKNKSLEARIIEKEAEKTALKKEIGVKDEIILSINTGFNQKVKELKDRIETFEELEAKRRKQEKEALRKEKKELKKLKKKTRKDEERKLSSFQPDIDSLDNNNEDCTICAEPIPDYKPSLFNGIEMNPACESCKEFSSDTEAHSEEIVTPTDSPFLDTTSLVSASLATNSLASTSLTTTSLATTSLSTTSLATIRMAPTTMDTTSLNLIKQDARNIPSEKTSKYVREPWKCDLCEFTTKMGYTFEQVLHKKFHEDEAKT